MNLKDFKAAAARRFASVTLPCGEVVTIRSLTAREFSEYVEGYVRDEDGQYIRERGKRYACRLIQLCVCDAKLKPLYPQPVADDSDVPKQIENELDQGIVKLLSDEIQNLVFAKKTAKNSPAGPTGNSPSDSADSPDSPPTSTSKD